MADNGPPTRRELDRLEVRVRTLEELELRSELRYLRAEVQEQGRTLTWILRTLITFAVTVIVAALVYALNAGA